MGRVREEKSQRREEKKREEKRRRKKIREEKESEERRSRCAKRYAKHCSFPMSWGSGGSKSRLAKAAGAEPPGQVRDEKLHAVVARSTFRSQKCSKLTVSEHAVVARSTFRSQKR